MAAKLCGETTKVVKDLVLRDVTPLSLGTEVYGDLMSVVVPRNTLIPTKKSKTFITSVDYQTSITAKVYQGERTKSVDNYLLGQLEISGIPPAPKRVSKVEDTYEIDANGILTVTCKVLSTGKTEQLTVTNHSGRLSKQDIEKMVENAEKFKIEDQEYKRKVDAYNALDDCLYKLKNRIKVSDIPQNVLKNMEYAIDDTTKWLSNNKAAEVNEIEAKKDYVEFLSRLSLSN